MIPYVIAVAGMPGAGKSTLIGNAIRALGDADSLHFDDYTRASDYPDIPEWVAGGCDANEWGSPGLAEHLGLLKAGQRIQTPYTARVVEPRQYILVEEPFGRARKRIAEHLDMVVVLELPIEISLARRLVRDINSPALAANPQGARDHVDDYCRKFLYEARRELILAGQRCALKRCDLVLDGTKTVERLTQEFLTALKQRGTIAA